MSKKLLQDMVKVKHVSRPPRESVQVPREPDERTPQDFTDQKHPKNKIWILAIASIIFFIFSLSVLFTDTVVKINPKTVELSLDERLTAKDSNTVDTLVYNVVVIDGEESKIVQAEEHKEISQSATGQVRIFNNFSSATQRLDVDTRLEGTNGKIYKTETSVVVPGREADGTPGSVDVNIYASETGESYNSPPLDFRIVGFKGSSKYSKFDVKSVNGEGVTGGFQGNFFVLTDERKVQLTQEFQSNLRAKLYQKAVDQTPEELVLFQNAIFLDVEESNIDEPSTTDTFTLKMQGVLYGILFDKSELTKKVTEGKVEQSDGASIYIDNLNELKFALTADTLSALDKSSIPFENTSTISFTLSGVAKVVWLIDDTKLRENLAGRSKKEFSGILLQHIGVDTADLSISPFWRRSFPDEASKIKVQINYPE